jgi:hypothetical protein
MFLLNLIFGAQSVVDKEVRGKLVDTLLKIERAMQSFSRVVGNSQIGVLKAFIPQNFYAEIKEHMWRWRG